MIVLLRWQLSGVDSLWKVKSGEKVYAKINKRASGLSLQDSWCW